MSVFYLRIVLIEPFISQDQLHEEQALKVTLLKELNHQVGKYQKFFTCCASCLLRSLSLGCHAV